MSNSCTITSCKKCSAVCALTMLLDSLHALDHDGSCLLESLDGSQAAMLTAGQNKSRSDTALQLQNLLPSMLQQLQSPRNQFMLQNEHPSIPFRIRIIPPNSYARSKRMTFKSYESTPKIFKMKSFLSHSAGERHLLPDDSVSGFVKFVLTDIFLTAEFYNELLKSVNTKQVMLLYGVSGSDSTLVSYGTSAEDDSPATKLTFALSLDGKNGRHYTLGGKSIYKTFLELSNIQHSILDLVIKVETQTYVGSSKRPRDVVQHQNTIHLLHNSRGKLDIEVRETILQEVNDTDGWAQTKRAKQNVPANQCNGVPPALTTAWNNHHSSGAALAIKKQGSKFSSDTSRVKDNTNMPKTSAVDRSSNSSSFLNDDNNKTVSMKVKPQSTNETNQEVEIEVDSSILSSKPNKNKYDDADSSSSNSSSSSSSSIGSSSSHEDKNNPKKVLIKVDTNTIDNAKQEVIFNTEKYALGSLEKSKDRDKSSSFSSNSSSSGSSEDSDEEEVSSSQPIHQINTAATDASASGKGDPTVSARENDQQLILNDLKQTAPSEKGLEMDDIQNKFHEKTTNVSVRNKSSDKDVDRPPLTMVPMQKIIEKTENKSESDSDEDDENGPKVDLNLSQLCEFAGMSALKADDDDSEVSQSDLPSVALFRNSHVNFKDGTKVSTHIKAAREMDDQSSSSSSSSSSSDSSSSNDSQNFLAKSQNNSSQELQKATNTERNFQQSKTSTKSYLGSDTSKNNNEDVENASKKASHDINTKNTTINGNKKKPTTTDNGSERSYSSSSSSRSSSSSSRSSSSSSSDTNSSSSSDDESPTTPIPNSDLLPRVVRSTGGGLRRRTPLVASNKKIVINVPRVSQPQK